jgi:hypothetical protein
MNWGGLRLSLLLALAALSWWDGLACALGRDLSVVVNAADDFEHLGLRISPDIDTVM